MQDFEQTRKAASKVAAEFDKQIAELPGEWLRDSPEAEAFQAILEAKAEATTEVYRKAGFVVGKCQAMTRADLGAFIDMWPEATENSDPLEILVAVYKRAEKGMLTIPWPFANEDTAMHLARVRVWAFVPETQCEIHPTKYGITRPTWGVPPLHAT